MPNMKSLKLKIIDNARFVLSIRLHHKVSNIKIDRHINSRELHPLKIMRHVTPSFIKFSNLLSEPYELTGHGYTSLKTQKMNKMCVYDF